MPRPRTISDEQLLDAALEVVHEDGPERLTLASVGRRAGVSAATLVQRFGSKANLLERVVAHANERLEGSLGAVPEPGEGESWEDVLVAWLVEAARPLQTRELMASHLWMLRRDLLEPSMRAHAQQFGQLFRGHMVTALEALFPDATPEYLEQRAWMLEAHWHGLIWQWALSGEGELEAWLQAGLRRVLTNS